MNNHIHFISLMYSLTCNLLCLYFFSAISVGMFAEHFYQLSMDDNRGFTEEYEVQIIFLFFLFVAFVFCILYNCKFLSVYFLEFCLINMRCHLLTFTQSLIPVGTEQTQKAALLPENKAKNRFNNVLPCKAALWMLDHVIMSNLDSWDGSDPLTHSNCSCYKKCLICCGVLHLKDLLFHPRWLVSSEVNYFRFQWDLWLH